MGLQLSLYSQWEPQLALLPQKIRHCCPRTAGFLSNSYRPNLASVRVSVKVTITTTRDVG